MATDIKFSLKRKINFADVKFDKYNAVVRKILHQDGTKLSEGMELVEVRVTPESNGR